MLSITERRQRIAVIQLFDKDNLNDKRRIYKGEQRTTNTVNDSNRSRFGIILSPSSLPYMYTITIHLHNRKSTKIKIIHAKLENDIYESFYFQ